MNHQQGSPAMLPCLDSISHILNPDRDTNFLSNLISSTSIKATFTIDLAKSLYERLDKDQTMFKSSKEVDWATEVLGYAFIPPHYQYVKEDKNYLKYVLNIYEFLLCNELEVVNDGKSYIKTTNNKQVLDYENYSHQKVLLKMLSHLTLLFDKRNFEKKPNPLVGDPRIREEEMKVPIKLCAIVIRIYNKFLLKAYPFLYIDHWEYVIKLLLGLASHILQASNDTKFPDRINVAIVELIYNSWILSGLQNEDMWTTFKNYIYLLINKDVVVSYWSDICHELTTKLLTDLKCYDAPQLIIQDKSEKIEYNESLLIISHNYNVRRSDIQSRNKFTLFLQPFIFNISQNQVQYLWGKMITMMSKITNNTITSPINNVAVQLSPRISLLIMKGIRNVVSLLLQLGAHSKPKDEILHYSEQQNYNEYSIENKRKILIEHDYSHFKSLLKQITKYGKIGLNERRPPQNVNSKSDEERAFRNIGNYSDVTSPKLAKRGGDDSASNFTSAEKEYSWVVKTEKIPSGESLLKLYGKLLFENATDTRSEYEDVRLMAVCTLCQIFTKASGPFLEPTVKKFYQVYLDYLGSNISWNNFQTLLKYSTELFLVNHLSHNIILQKPLVTKLVEFYKKPKGDPVFGDKKVLRRSCNKLCSSLLCFFNDESGLINEVYRYEKNVKDIFYELLEFAFEKDKEAFLSHPKGQKEEVKILARSAWNFMIYSILDYKVALFVKKFDDKNEWFDKASPILNNLVIDILLVLGEMFLTKLDECETSNQMSHDILESGHMIIDNICKFIEVRIKDLDPLKQALAKNTEKEELARTKEETTKLLSSCFGILHTWLLIIVHLKDINRFEQRSNNEQIYSEIFEQALRLLQNYQNIEPFSKNIKGMISSLFNRLGSMSFSKNVPFTSSVLLNDDRSKNLSLEELVHRFEEKCLLSIGVDEDTILSFYDLQVESTNEALLLMIRNTVGKFAWFGELYYKLFCPTKKEPEDGIKEVDLVKRAISTKEEDSKPRLMSHDMLLSPRSGGANQELELLLQQQFEVEDQYEETYNKNKEKQQIQERPAEVPTQTQISSYELDEEEKSLAKINAIKMFLSNTGILNLKDLQDLTHIPPDLHSKESFRTIDQTPTRCQILTSIFYVLKPSSERIDEFPRFDTLFQKFIEEMGIIVDESTLELGAHESIRRYVSQHKKVLYASNPLYEIVFSLPNLSAAQPNFLETFTVSPITIIWNAKVFTPYESFYPYIINHFDIKGYKTAIVITPLNEGYFNLNVLKKDSDFMMFPPVNDFICSAHMLANVVLQTIISIHKEYQLRNLELYYHEAVLGKVFHRKEHISALINSYKKKEDSSWELLKAFFNSPKTVNKH